MSVLTCGKYTTEAKFWKLLRKIFARLLFQRKIADFRNSFGKRLQKNLRRSSKEDFEKRCTFSKLL